MPELSRLELVVDSKGVVTANGNLDLFKKKSDDAAKAATSIKNGGDVEKKSFDAQGAAANAAALAYAAAAAAPVLFVQNVLKASGQMETIETNLRVVTGSAEKADQVFRNLKTFAAATPFSLPGITDTAIQLLNVGVEASDLTKTLKMLGDVSGGSQEKLNRIMMNYTQILSVGKAQTMDIKQFAQANLPIYQALEEVTGKTGDELQEMITSGQITGDVITAAFQKMTEEGGKFFNGMALGAETLEGKLSTMKDSLNNLSAVYGNMVWGGLAKLAATGITWAADKAANFLSDIHEAKEIADKVNNAIASGMTGSQAFNSLSVQERVSYAQKQTELASDYMKEQQRFANLSPGNQENYLRANAQFQLWSETLEHARKELREYTEEEKRAAEEKAELTKRIKEGTELLSQQSGIYSQTEAGRLDAIRAEIAKQKALLGKSYTDRNGDVQQLDDNKTLQNITYLENQLVTLTKRAKDAKTELSDWQKVLKSALNLEDADVATGYQAVDAYMKDMHSQLNGALIYAEATGGDIDQVYKDYAKQIDIALNEILASGKFDLGDTSVQGMLNARAGAFEAAGPDTSAYDKQVKELRDRQSAANGDTWQEQRKSDLGAIGLTGGQADALIKLEEETRAIEAQADQLKNLQGIWKSLGMEIVDFAANAAFNSLYDLGEALYEGGDAAKVFARSLLTSILQSVPAMLFQAGFKLAISPGGLYAGLALMAASGIAAVGSGYLLAAMNEDTESSENDKLEAIVDQISDLVSQAREDSEYYVSTLQSKKASYSNSIVSVNDAIISPSGKIISTAPDDYLIASKNPWSLTGGGTNVNVVISNTASDTVSATATTKQREDGTIEIIAMVDKIVAHGIGKGTYESAFEARNQRIRGRAVVS